MARRTAPELTFQQHIADFLVRVHGYGVLGQADITDGPEPSPSDIEKQLKTAGVVMGIALLDHIIFNRSGYFSFLEAGRL